MGEVLRKILFSSVYDKRHAVVIWRPAAMLIDSSEFTNFMIGIFIEKPNDVKILPTSAHPLKASSRY